MDRHVASLLAMTIRKAFIALNTERLGVFVRALAMTGSEVEKIAHRIQVVRFFRKGVAAGAFRKLRCIRSVGRLMYLPTQRSPFCHSLELRSGRWCDV